jgi:hypothetical protein
MYEEFQRMRTERNETRLHNDQDRKKLRLFNG